MIVQLIMLASCACLEHDGMHYGDSDFLIGFCVISRFVIPNDCLSDFDPGWSADV